MSKSFVESYVSEDVRRGGLLRALERGELTLHFQPKIDMTSTNRAASVIGYEALLRWISPAAGSISPGDFLSWAERSHEVREVGYWVAAEACHQLSVWRENGIANERTTISINLLGRQLCDPHLPEILQKTTAHYNIEPPYLNLEVTESALATEPTSLECLGDLQKLGFQLHLDDFGHGYSSLSFIHRFPFDCMKIDRTIIADLDQDGQSVTMTHSLLELGRRLHMDVIAEGVETKAHIQMLLDMGCRLGQGFFFARPMSANSMERWLNALRAA